MSYSIHYGPDWPVPKSQKKFRHKWFLAVFILLICVVGAIHTWPEEAQQLRQALFPWTRPVAREALTQLVSDVREGERLDDALTVFCREILDEADKSE